MQILKQYKVLPCQMQKTATYKVAVTIYHISCIIVVSLVLPIRQVQLFQQLLEFCYVFVLHN